MTRTFFTLLAVFAASVAVLGSTPVHAGTVDWAAAKAAFDEGADPANAPTSEKAFAYCAAYWTAWNDAARAGKVPPEAGTQVNPTLVAPKVGHMRLQWQTWIELGDDPAASAAYFQQASPAVTLQVAKALTGDGPALQAVMTVLGACKLPDQG